MSSPVSYDLQGQGGGVVVDNSSGNVVGNFRWIQVINDAEFVNVSSSNIANATNLSAITIPAGVGIGGKFTDIEVTSGVVIAYYA